MIEHYPLPIGNVERVYTNHDYSQRITLFSLPNCVDVYYVVERKSNTYSLETIYTSEIFNGVEALLTKIMSMTDITDRFT